MITVLSCVWQRPENLSYMLWKLGAQTFRDFKLVLINNNVALTEFVNTHVACCDFEVEVIHNAQNRGPFARLEVMCSHNSNDWFMTIDDDAIFDETLLAQWWNQRADDTLQGWNGFRFRPGGTYWDRNEVKSGDVAHYLWGSNLFIPSNIIDWRLLRLEDRYWQCDDLWLCYHASHLVGADIRKAQINGLSINVDGKDTYVSQHHIKSELLNSLRNAGWQV